MLQEESVPHGTRLIDLDVFRQNISVIFAIQVTLEDADDNNNTQQNGEKHALSSTF